MQRLYFTLCRGFHRTPRGYEQSNKGIRWGTNKQPQDWLTTLAMVGWQRENAYLRNPQLILRP